LVLEKKNTITNGNNGKQVKEARMTPPPVNIKDIKSTEVLSMDVIPNKNVLSNKHIDNIERVVTQMQNTFDRVHLFQENSIAQLDQNIGDCLPTYYYA
jgi:hypothetical protein